MYTFYCTISQYNTITHCTCIVTIYLSIYLCLLIFRQASIKYLFCLVSICGRFIIVEFWKFRDMSTCFFSSKQFSAVTGSAHKGQSSWGQSSTNELLVQPSSTWRTTDIHVFPMIMWKGLEGGFCTDLILQHHKDRHTYTQKKTKIHFKSLV